MSAAGGATGVPLGASSQYPDGMAKTPSVEDALARAQQAQRARMDAIRTVAEARQSVADVRESTNRELADFQRKIAERVSAAEREDVKAFNAALAAGWTAEELRKIGFAEPEKKVRVRQRVAKRGARSEGQQTTDDTTTK